MGRDRFVDPEVVRVELSDGDWLDVKKRLGTGERLTLKSAAFGRMAAGPSAGGERGTTEAEIGVDYRRYYITQVRIWVVGWSFTKKGKPVPVSDATIAALDEETFDEIEVALNAHMEAMEAAKKRVSGTTPTTST